MNLLSFNWLWFNLLLAVLLLLDLGVFNRKAHHVSSKEAVIWTCVWITIALIFNGGVYYFMGVQAGLEWSSGYLIEKALSVDNIFVIAIVMSTFAVPDEYQHRLLFLGVIGALVMRLGLILIGAYLLEHWHWLFYVFGAFLIFTGWKMFATEEEFKLDRQPLLKWMMENLPVSKHYEGMKLVTSVDGKLLATPFLLAVIVIETTDLIFAIDSIPAVFAITSNTFIVYSSNAFAILGLRSLYFLLADAMQKFHYLKHGLGMVLVLVGAKMALKDFLQVPPIWSLLAILIVLGAAIVYSIKHPGPADAETAPQVAEKCD